MLKSSDDAVQSIMNSAKGLYLLTYNDYDDTGKVLNDLARLTGIDVNTQREKLFSIASWGQQNRIGDVVYFLIATTDYYIVNEDARMLKAISVCHITPPEIRSWANKAAFMLHCQKNPVDQRINTAYLPLQPTYIGLEVKPADASTLEQLRTDIITLSNKLKEAKAEVQNTEHELQSKVLTLKSHGFIVDPESLK